MTGKKFNTRGGWLARIYTYIENNPVGFCIDPISGVEEPFLGIWDESSGKCLKRGDWTESEICSPYDIIK